jgi:hypothetical protein
MKYHYEVSLEYHYEVPLEYHYEVPLDYHYEVPLEYTLGAPHLWVHHRAAAPQGFPNSVLLATREKQLGVRNELCTTTLRATPHAQVCVCVCE